MQCKGYVDSVYHGSCVDGCGIRSVVFFSGCNLRCPFCHNPETLYLKGKEYDVKTLVNIVLRYKNYYKNGGVTLSGGEPFMQAEFCIKLIDELKSKNVSVICETNGYAINEELIKRLDGVRLDVKNYNKEDCSTLINKYGRFIEECFRYSVPLTITNVLCPQINDDKSSLYELNGFLRKFLIEKQLEFLPFKKNCEEKYRNLGVDFPFSHVSEADAKTVENAKKIFESF